MDYYTSHKISEHVTQITSLTNEFLYLIEGEREAALIDTCLGIGNLRAFVENLTKKPLTVILTHGHVDHAMGAPEFDRVYMSSKDNPVFMEHKALEVRKEYIAMALGDRTPKLEDKDFVSVMNPNFEELQEGDSFDLGGIHLEIYAAGGHTPGTMAILIAEERTLILGDACNHSTFLFDKNSYSVEKYQQSMQQLDVQTRGKYDRVYLCHHEAEASGEILQQIIILCREIMNRETDDIPFEFMGQKSYFAKAVDKNLKRLDGGLGNIIYDTNKIFEE
ncbi:MBL fold metallo-hydrolase [Paenibacillus sp. HW567]|uniref:MBL fold metallo-hydrolase n=1 Tax=Paenibacillus sp. HW567 TaxID=1034769 RepID=UPI00035E344D|nr:MBL fold metallo-hydrolase [Paenibacillus sp. HW567]